MFIENKLKKSVFTILSIAYSVCAFLTGTSYLIAQFWINNTIADPLFIGLLMSNNVIVLRVITFLEARVKDVENAGVNNFYSKIFNLKFAVITSLVFFSIFFSITISLKPTNNFNLDIYLALFLGTSNLLTGAGTAAMIAYVIHSFYAEIY